MSDSLHYHTLAELRALSLDELRALWELVPTDRQRAYRAAYDREVKTAGAEGSDAKERKIALALLKRYHEAALAADQRDLWERERGIPLEPDAAQDLADYTREQWEIDL